MSNSAKIITLAQGLIDQERSAAALRLIQKCDGSGWLKFTPEEIQSTDRFLVEIMNELTDPEGIQINKSGVQSYQISKLNFKRATESKVSAPSGPTEVIESPIMQVERSNGQVKTYQMIQTIETKEPELEATDEPLFQYDEKNNEWGFNNGKTFVSYRVDSKEFSGRDNTDLNNLPSFYSQTKRSHKKAFEALKEGFTAETTMYQAMSLITGAGVRCRSYCAMD